MRLAACLLIAGLAMGCRWQFERMLVQHKVHDDDPLRLAILAATPPPGTVPYQVAVGLSESQDPDAFQTGCSGGVYAAKIPIAITPSLLDDGKRRFDLFCATCHGRDGQGETPVAKAMELSPPKSLVAPPIRDYPPGRLFRTITLSNLRMPSYRNELDERARWAVIAYLRKLPALPAASAAQVAAPSPGPVCEERP
jgi:mono/diheme cytochrome c family protein